MTEINIISEKRNNLFNRKEIQAEIEAPSSPQTAEIQKIIADKFSKPEDAVVMQKIKGNFGTRIFAVTAKVYDSKEDKESFERKKKENKKAEPAKEVK